MYIFLYWTSSIRNFHIKYFYVLILVSNLINIIVAIISSNYTVNEIFQNVLSNIHNIHSQNTIPMLKYLLRETVESMKREKSLEKKNIILCTCHKNFHFNWTTEQLKIVSQYFVLINTVSIVWRTLSQKRSESVRRVDSGSMFSTTSSISNGITRELTPMSCITEIHRASCNRY